MYFPNHLIKEFLDEKYDLYNRPEFIVSDPIQIPHQYSLPEDIEIAGFMTATIAWGQRKSIINNANKLMQLMGNNPYDFVLNAGPEHLEKLQYFVHRTFQGVDCIFFLRSLQNIYKNRGGLKNVFESSYVKEKDMVNVLIQFRDIFFEIEGHSRTRKHISDVNKNADR